VALQHARNIVTRAGMTICEPEFVKTPRRESVIGAVSACARALLCGMGVAALSGATAAYATEAADLYSQKNMNKLFDSDASIVHVGGRDTFNITPLGRAAGTTFYQALVQHNPELAKEASKTWDLIIPKENYGGEYTELQWFATYFTADANSREKMTADPYTNFFYHYFADGDYANLKEYLKRKYHAADIGDEETYTGQQRKSFLEDLTLFANPRREQWEKTSAFVKIIDPKPGEVIADVGSGPGYYSFKMAERVGPKGKVYAIDTEEPHIKYVNAAKLAMNVNNVETIQTDGRTLGAFTDKADKVVLVSLYHNIYAMTNDDDRQTFLDSIKSKLKDGGHLYLIDNSLVPRGAIPYHGPYIAKELVAAQLEHSGFKLEAYYQPIIQRYALVFRYSAPKTPSGK
jgi:SAM-dependent methyltransferase